MRLPRSSNTYPSIRLFFAITLIVFAAARLCAAASTPQLVCSPSKLRFGTVLVNQSETQLISVTNTGSKSATISAISISSSEFKVSGLSLPVMLAAGQSVTLRVIFAPTATVWTGGKVTFTSTASNPSLNLAVAGIGVRSEPLTATPSNISFGQVAVGSTAKLTVSLTNPHPWKETVSALQTAGTGFSVTGPKLPMTLSTGQKVTLKISFSPPAAGLTGGRVFLAGPSLSIPLQGTGTNLGALTVSPAKLDFGKVMIGETDKQIAVLTATGASVTIASASSSNSQFALPGVTFPFTINAGSSVQFQVAFTPQQAGAASAKLSFSSNASGTQASEAVTGTGTPPQVSLGWSPSTSDVQGYNVYRGTSPGVYTKINAALDPYTSYTDTKVSPGQTYYYAATAVSPSGQESTYSAPAAVTVP